MNKDCSINFLRHGETLNNKLSIVMGSIDQGLSYSGIKQAVDTRSIIDTMGFYNIFVSPKLRCLQTAYILLKDIKINNIEIVDGLKSRSRGSWEGKSWQEIDKIRADFNLSLTDVPKDAENWNDFLSRSYTAIEYIISQNNSSLIIGHTGTFYALCEYFEVGRQQIAGCKLVKFSRKSLVLL